MKHAEKTRRIESNDMTSATDGDRTDQWIGSLQADGVAYVLTATGVLDGPGELHLSLPATGKFNIPVRFTAGSDGELVGELPVLEKVRTLTLNTWTSELLSGIVSGGALPADVELHRVLAWPHAAYREASASYDLGGGRVISFFANLDEWVGNPVMFYAENERFVSVYPTDERTVRSEEGEVFIFSADKSQLEQVSGPAHRLDAPVIGRRTALWHEEEVNVVGDGGGLCGTLFTPPGDGPFPAAVMIHGAAGGRRDYYRAFAAQYATVGIAALVYDRRGWGCSEGKSNPTFLEKADDAQTWAEYLRTRPDIIADGVGMWGFSNGSWVAPLAATRDPRAAFVAVIGAAGTSPLEQEVFRRAFELRSQGVREDIIEVVSAAWRLVYVCLLSGALDDDEVKTFEGHLRTLSESGVADRVRLQEYAVQQPFLGPLPPYADYQDLLADRLNHNVSPPQWLLDPADSYRVLDVPVLYMVGADDSNLPAATSAKRVAEAVAVAGNTDATLVMFPNTGHGMNLGLPGIEGMTNEEAGYRMHNYRFAGGYLDLIESWAARLCRRFATTQE